MDYSDIKKPHTLGSGEGRGNSDFWLIARESLGALAQGKEVNWIKHSTIIKFMFSSRNSISFVGL
jgi:hypothetical protein